jgi:hypothetical protein
VPGGGAPAYRCCDAEDSFKHNIGDRLVRRTLAVDAAAIEHDDGVGNQCREIQIVKDRNCQCPAADTTLDRFHHAELMA